MQRPHSCCALALTLTLLATGCKNSKLGSTLSWRTQTFVRVPAKLPNDYDARDPMPLSAEGWNFKHIVACPKRKEPEAHWWMVWPEDETKLKLGNASWIKMLFTGSAIRISDWHKIAAVTPEIAAACLERFKVYPQMVQPDLIFKPDLARKKADQSRKAIRQMDEKRGSNVAALELGALPVGGWAKGPREQPPYDPLWHQRADFTQIEQAKKEVRRFTGSAGGGIRIGILDSGYNYKHLLVPKNTIGSDGKVGTDRKGERRGDAINTLACASGSCPVGTPGETNGEHGMKAMSILAGGAFPLFDPQRVDPQSAKRRAPVIDEKQAARGIELGGAPDAVVVPARVAPWVFSHSTANLAYAIDYASRVQKCDVISMSHGGTPSPMWIDAVNAAYDRGTSIFAACGDYYNLPWFNLGLIAPSASVYPAACRRVQGVCGVTASGAPYGKTDALRYGWRYLTPWKWLHMRGTFGADGGYRDILHHSSADMNERTDRAQRDAGGMLRAQPISTWAPNIASAQPPIIKDNVLKPNILNLEWGGTSCNTPQAAAAAALWLARNRKEIEAAGKWHDWQKAEAVYVAMLKTAGGRAPGTSAPPLAQHQPDLYCGAGSLKAADMLKVSFDNACHTKQAKVLEFPEQGMHRDFYDGQRSGAAILGWSKHFAPYRQRADALTKSDHVIKDPALKQAALGVIYYNQRLVQQWNIGRIPLRDEKADRAESADDLKDPRKRERHENDPLHKRKSALWRYFSPDDPELRAEAREMAAKCNSNP